MRSRLIVAFATLLVLGLMAPVQGAGHWEANVIATGLDNPRGIDVGSNGTVYVALSGRGGSEQATGPVQGALAAVCLGDTGAVIALDGDGGYETIARLPSLAGANPDGSCGGTGFAATGPSNISAIGKGTLQLAMGLGGGARGDASGAFGATHSVLPNGKVKPLADILGHETANDSDGAIDSNPYGIDHVPGGTLVADAGANALFLTRPNGSIETVAVFPPIFGLEWPAVSCPLPFPTGEPVPFPVQPVPTSVAVGPDGAYYVGTLTGFPFPTGASAVYRVDQHTGVVTPYVTGLTHVTGLEWGPDGALYIAQMTNGSLLDLEACGGDTPGSVLRVTAAGTETIATLPIVGDVAVDRDGVVYATALSILPGGGLVYALTP